jgi:diguanylate cyclase
MTVGELQRLRRALRTLGAANRALVHAVDDQALLQRICRVVVEEGGYRLAWASFAVHDEHKSIKPIAHAGFELGWLDTLNNTWADTARGRGPTGTAIRTGRPQVVRDVQSDSDYAPWRVEAARRGYASVASLPLVVENAVIGALTLYASEPDAFDEEELELLLHAAADLGYGIGVLRTRAQARAAEETVRRLAYYDPLTGLPNRVRLREILDAAIGEARKENHALSLLIVGIRRFHQINDALGYLEGDRLLVEAAGRVAAGAAGAQCVARVGEEEFAVLLANSGAKRAIETAHVLLKALHEPVELSRLMVDPHPGVGIALYPGHGTDPDTLLRRGNLALYKAKRAGSEFAVYTGALDKEGERILRLVSDLPRAIENNELRLYCQPKVHMRDRKTCGSEALVRWLHPEHGIVVPEEFVIPAERSGLVTPITYWVLDAALRQNYAWREAGLAKPISVNLSARDLHDPRFVEYVQGSLATWGTAAGDIQFELTESALMEEPDAAIDVLTRLKELGIHLSIDDFGTGYSSLSYLQRLPVDAIKIDRSFVADVTTSAAAETIVRCTIDLAHNLDLGVVAEGVDSEATWERMAMLDCDMAQGYWISKPIPTGEFSAWQTRSGWNA